MLVLLFLAGVGPAHAAPAPPRRTTAPPLQKCTVTKASDLGLWDDLFVPRGLDVIVLRRGEELFSLDMTGPLKPRKRGKVPAVAGTRMIAAAAAGKRLWVFLNSHKTVPCAVDVNSGAVVKFSIPGLAVPGSQTPEIQAHVLLPRAQAALLMVAGGDRATWPRDGNRPLFFWMDLKSGKVVRFPTGWDLDYFSADERIAVFATPLERPFERRPLQAVALSTGKRINTLPDRRKERYIPFDWTRTQAVKPLYERREGKGDADYFAGLSGAGHAVPVSLGLKDVRYLAMARASGGFAGFRLRHEGQGAGDPDPLWVFPLKDPDRIKVIATGVIDFALLGRGNAVYVTTGHGRRHASSEVFYRAWGSDTSWNVLEGVKRLPPLEKAFADADYIVDRLTVKLIEGFGAGRTTPLVLCLFDHKRMDLRAYISTDKGPKLKPATWRRTLVVTQDGKRFLAPLFGEKEPPELIWLHHSGKLLTGVWDAAGADHKRQVRLSMQSIRIAR